jgi:hypothetical protein
MSQAKQGLFKIGVAALGYALAGCSGADVSAGSEGEAINLNRCYGADCGVHAQALSGTGVDATPCAGVVGALEQPLLFESIGENSYSLAAFQAADGTVWALQSVRGSLDRGPASIYLARYSSAGALLATSGVIAHDESNSLGRAALAVDAAGEATVAIYSSYAPNADAEVQEELTLYGFDFDLQPAGASRTFRGIATPHLVGGPGGSVWLAGNAFGNAPHGTIARITNREPDWIQTAVPTAGQSVDGFSGLTVADDGVAAVLARLNPKWSGEGPNVTKLGLATFDAAGKPLWTLELPGDYTQGYSGVLAGSAQGNLVVASVVGENGENGENHQQLLLRSISRDGELGWAYTVPFGFGLDVDMHRDSGRAFVGTGNGLAVIDATGENCRQFSIGPATEAPTETAAWDASAEYVLTVGGPLARYRVPE